MYDLPSMCSIRISFFQSSHVMKTTKFYKEMYILNKEIVLSIVVYRKHQVTQEIKALICQNLKHLMIINTITNISANARRFELIHSPF